MQQPNGIRLEYSHDLLAVNALLYCNKNGKTINDVITTIEKNSRIREDIRSAVSCLNGYAQKYNINYNIIEEDVRLALKRNPTLEFLRLRSKGINPHYEEFYVKKALDAQENGRFDKAVDNYARLMNLIKDNNPIFRTGATVQLLMINEHERDGLNTLYYCIKDEKLDDTFDNTYENLYSKIFKKTNSRDTGIFDNENFKLGIPCIDTKTSLQEKKDAYMRLGIGIRSEIFKQAIANSNGGMDDIKYNLKRYALVLNDIKKLEEHYKNSLLTSQNDILVLPSPMHKIVRLNSQINSLSSKQPRTITYSQLRKIKAGIAQCGAGIVEGSISPEGLKQNGLFIAAGIAIGVAASPLVAGTGAVFVGSTMLLATGVYFTAEQTITLADHWNTMSLEEKTTGLCGTILTGVMTAAGAKAHTEFVKTPKLTELKYTGTGIEKWKTGYIEVKTAVKTKLKEQVAKLKNKPAKSRAEPKIQSDSSSFVEWIKNEISEVNQAKVMSAARMRFAKMPPEKQTLFMDIWKEYDKKGFEGAMELRRQKLGENMNDPVKYELWKNTDTDIIRMHLNLPKNWKRYKDVLKAVMDPKLELDLGTRLKMYKHGIFENAINSNKFLNTLKKIKKKGLTNLFDESEIKFIKEISEKSVSDDVRRNIDSSFWYDVKSTKMIEMFDEALVEMKISPHDLKYLNVKYLDEGFYKIVDRGNLETTVGKKTDFVVKKGTISDKDIEIAREMSKYDITAKPFNKKLYKFDDKNVYVEEYVHGEKLTDAITNGVYSVDKIAEALGELNGRIIGFIEKSKIRYNSDVRGDNIKIYKDMSDNVVVKIIDYDTKDKFYHEDMLYHKYFFSTILKNSIELKASRGTGINVYDYYFNGVHKQMQNIFGQETGTKAFNTIMRKAESDFRSVGPDFDISNWMIPDDIATISNHPLVRNTIREIPEKINNYLPGNAETFTEAEFHLLKRP